MKSTTLAEVQDVIVGAGNAGLSDGWLAGLRLLVDDGVS